MSAVTCAEVADDAQHRVDDRDRVAADEGAGDRGQRGIPRGCPSSGRRGAARRVRDPSSPAGSPMAAPRRAVRPAGRRADADQLRAASSLAWAASRSAVSRSSSRLLVAERLLRLRSAPPPRRPGWTCASATALSAFCLASRAADSLFTCSVRARCRLVDHLLRAGGQRLAGRRGGDDVRGVGRGQVGVRRAVDVRGRGEGVEALLRGGDRGVGVVDRAAGWRRLPAARRRRCRARSGRRRSPC